MKNQLHFVIVQENCSNSFQIQLCTITHVVYPQKNVAHQATPMVVCPNASSSMAVYGMLLHQRRLQLALMDCRSSADDDQLETSSRESFVHSFHPSRCC